MTEKAAAAARDRTLSIKICQFELLEFFKEQSQDSLSFLSFVKKERKEKKKEASRSLKVIITLITYKL